MTTIYMRNVHYLLLFWYDVLLINSLAAAHCFPMLAPQHGPALFGLLVYMPCGRTVAPVPDWP